MDGQGRGGIQAENPPDHPSTPGREYGPAVPRTRAIHGGMDGGYFRLSEHDRSLPELDHWIRRRIRACYWKQWRNVRTKVRELIKLGTKKRTAIQAAMSRKSYWRLSKTLATQTGLTNDWLKRQGLLSLKERWVSFHYPSGTKVVTAFETTV